MCWPEWVSRSEHRTYVQIYISRLDGIDHSEKYIRHYVLHVHGLGHRVIVVLMAEFCILKSPRHIGLHDLCRRTGPPERIKQ